MRLCQELGTINAIYIYNQNIGESNINAEGCTSLFYSLGKNI